MENPNTAIQDMTSHIYYTDKLFSIMLKFCPTSYNSAEGAIKNCTGRVNLLTSDFHLEIPSISYA